MRSYKCWPNVVLVCICKDTQPVQNYAKKKRKEKKVVAFCQYILSNNLLLHYFQHHIYYSLLFIRTTLDALCHIDIAWTFAFE